MWRLLGSLSLAILIGCAGKKDEPVASDQPTPQPRDTVKPADPPKKDDQPGDWIKNLTPKGDKTPPALPPEPAFVVTTKQLIDDYTANEIAADKKYRGKRGRVSVVSVGKVGRTPKGVAYLGMNVVAPPSEPSLFFHFETAEDDVANMKSGVTQTVEGVCLGRKRDGIGRPESRPLDGYDWRIDFTDCKIVPNPPALPKK